jgi:arylsulfatase A-like enzyme
MQWMGRIKPGTTFDLPILNLDLLPTAVVAAGGQVDPAWKLDGVDLMPYLTGEKKGSPHATLYWRFGEQWAVRKGDWKLCANRIDGVNSPRLFNLKEDIGEANDLSAAHPDKLEELQAEWNKWNSEQSEPRWRPAPRRARAARKANRT